MNMMAGYGYQFLRLINTVKYMSGRQWVYRIRNTVLKKIPRKASDCSTLDTDNIQKICYLYADEYSDESSIQTADSVVDDRIPTISDIYLSFSDGHIDWDLKSNDYRLVCFRLNSFKFLLQLSDAHKMTGDSKYIEKGYSLIYDWINQCGKTIRGDKWNAYVIAERMMNWVGFYSACSEFCQDKKALISSISSQAIELRNSIEYQMGANHLLSEAKSLMYAGVFLQNEFLYRYGKNILRNGFEEQFLTDGGNYERSLSYHVEALQQYFEAVMIMHDIGDKDFESFRTKLIEPYVFLNSMFGADGHIPLINDSAYDYPFDAADFLGTARILYGVDAPNAVEGSYSRRWERVGGESIDIDWDTVTFHKVTGFLMEKYRIKNEEFSLFFDAGDIGADINPGHAHADSLNILWSAKGKPIFVDSGVYTYRPGKERNACRGTAAHNTVEVDHTDSSEVWAAFRVGKRARTTVKSYENKENKLEIAASHDGYRKMLKEPVTHTRRVRLDKSTGEIRIDDLLSGRGSHTGVLRYHISPDCKVQKINYNAVLIDGRYSFKCSEDIVIEDCTIAEYFGKPREGKCIRVDFTIDGKRQVQSRLTVNREERT